MSLNRLAVALALASWAPVANGQARGDQPGLAASHYQTGNAEYRAGHFREAAAEFRAAYELSHEPALLFNIGSALSDAGDLPGALEAFEQYLRVLPNASNRGIVSGRIESIRQRLAAAAPTTQSTTTTTTTGTTATTTTPTPAPATAATPPPASRSTLVATPVATAPNARSESATSTPVAPIVLVAGGALAFGAAGLFYALRGSALAQCSEEAEAIYCPDAGTANDLVTYNTLTNVGLGVGGVAVAAGIAWFLLGRGRATPQQQHVVVGVLTSPTSGAITLNGSF